MEMDPVLHLQYLSWATKLILDAAKALPPEEYERDRGSSHGGIRGTLEHTFKADWLWFSRISGEPFVAIHDIPSPTTLAELENEWLAVLERWQNWVKQLTSNQFSIHIRYKNTAGVDYSTPIWQIVLHLVNHNTMHRGQVVTMIRQAGAKPPLTDLIAFYRELDAQAAAGPR